MEEDGDHVDGYEDRCASSSGHAEQDEYSAGLEEFDGEDAARGGGEDCVDLLETEQDEQDAGAAEKPDDLSAVPGVGQATEGDGHDA